MASAVPDLPVPARDQAFENLYRSYIGDVYRYALALLRNPADAEDVTQTTFMNAYSAIQRGDEIRKPHNWLIKIAHNTARSRFAHVWPTCERGSARGPRRTPCDAAVGAAEHRRGLAGARAVAVQPACGARHARARGTNLCRDRRDAGRLGARRRDAHLPSAAGVATPSLFAPRAHRRSRSDVARAPRFRGQRRRRGRRGAGRAGLLAKAAVAIVAGVVAVGIGGDKTRTAVAAAKARRPARSPSRPPAQPTRPVATTERRPVPVGKAEPARRVRARRRSTA